jgi:hypothetical protein
VKSGRIGFKAFDIARIRRRDRVTGKAASRRLTLLNKGEKNMNPQDNCEDHKQKDTAQPQLADLPLTPENAEMTKAGETQTFHVYPGFIGGVRVAAGD